MSNTQMAQVVQMSTEFDRYYYLGLKNLNMEKNNTEEFNMEKNNV